MGKIVRNRFIKLLMAAIDLVVLYFSFMLAYQIRFHPKIPTINLTPFLDIAPWLGISALIIFYFFDLYSSSTRRDIHHHIYSILLSVGLLIIIAISLSFWVRGFSFPRSVILISALIQVILMVVIRSLIWMLQIKMSGKKQVLIIGDNFQDGIQIAEKFLDHTKGWFEIRTFLTFEQKKEIRELLPLIDVILLAPDLSKEKKAEMLSYSSKHNKEVLLVPDLYELFLMGAEPQQIDDMLVFSIMPPRLETNERVLKRGLDLVVSFGLLIISSPIMLLLFFLIPLNSKGKAIYKQERLGRNEKPYMLYKFRSMITDAEKKTGPVLASEEDPRITSIGKFIRATRLDELPQLFNVIKGDMSLVGPRPERAVFIKQFKSEMPYYTYRMVVKPGITGLAQVMAKYSTTVEDKLRYDLMYIRNYSIILDLKILFLTFLVVLRKEQAKGVSVQDKEKQDFLYKVLNLPYSEMVSAKEK